MTKPILLALLVWDCEANYKINEHNQLVIHFNEEQTSGVVASLAPLLPVRRELLIRAIAGRMDHEWIDEIPPDIPLEADGPESTN